MQGHRRAELASVANSPAPMAQPKAARARTRSAPQRSIQRPAQHLVALVRPGTVASMHVIKLAGYFQRDPDRCRWIFHEHIEHAVAPRSCHHGYTGVGGHRETLTCHQHLRLLPVDVAGHRSFQQAAGDRTGVVMDRTSITSLTCCDCNDPFFAPDLLFVEVAADGSSQGGCQWLTVDQQPAVSRRLAGGGDGRRLQRTQCTIKWGGGLQRLAESASQHQQ